MGSLPGNKCCDSKKQGEPHLRWNLSASIRPRVEYLVTLVARRNDLAVWMKTDQIIRPRKVSVIVVIPVRNLPLSVSIIIKYKSILLAVPVSIHFNVDRLRLIIRDNVFKIVPPSAARIIGNH